MAWDVSKGLEGLDHNFLTGKRSRVSRPGTMPHS
jgi:hypothetical protein